MNNPVIRLAAVAVGVLLLAAGCSSDESSVVDFLPFPTGLVVDGNGVDEGCVGFEGDGGASGVLDTGSLDGGRGVVESSGFAHVFVGGMYFPVTVGVVPLGVSVRVYAEPLSVDPSSYEGERDFMEGGFVLVLRSGGVGVLERSFRVDRPVFFREGRPVLGRLPRPGSVGDGGVLPVADFAGFTVRVVEPPVYDSFAVFWAGRELFAAERPVSAPRAEVLGVSEGQVFNAWDGIDLCLDGVDIGGDGDSLSFRVYYSTDGGDTYGFYTGVSLYPYAEWQEIHSRRVRVSLGSFNSRRLNDGRGGFVGRVGMAVSDGASTVFVESPTFSVLPRGEQPNIFRIRGVGYNVVFTGDEMISLEARGGSGLGGDTRYSWRSSLDGDLGSGKVIELPAGELTLGEHTVTVVATDETSGLSYNHSGTFSVIPAGTPFMASDDMVHLRPQAVGYIGRVSGYDSFEYEVCDRDSFCDTAVVRVGVGVADCTILGKDGDDHLIGTPDDDIICGLGGDDTIEGGGGDDIIRAGAGDDTIFGGSGNDYIQGETGQTTNSLCQTTTTANTRNPNQQRIAIASFVCETSKLTRTIAYEHKCPQAHSSSSCNYQSVDFRDALKRDAQVLYTPLVENTRQITEETLNKLRQLAEAIHEFAITIYRDEQPAYL